VARLDLHRLLEALKLVPREPRWKDTTDLAEEMKTKGVLISRRTLQRDLERLSEMRLGLECLRVDKPYRWRLTRETDGIEKDLIAAAAERGRE
jgi:predicted DNA-binding transcriptional regulator YafY